MNLAIPQSKKTKKYRLTKDAHEFMRISYLCYVMEWIKVTDRLLDEYIYWMNKKFDMYANRIHNVLPIDQIRYSSYHINNFTHIIQNVNLSNLAVDSKYNFDINQVNKRMVIDFYEEILELVDWAINEKYFYGRSLTDAEHEKIIHLIGRRYPGYDMVCNYDRITLGISMRHIDDVNDFIIKIRNKFPNLISHQTSVRDEEDELKIVLDNQLRHLCFGDIWDIIFLCNNDIKYFDILKVLIDKNELVLNSRYCSYLI